MKNALRVLLLLAMGGLIYYAYFVQIINPYHHTGYVWLTAHWHNISNYSHGPLIPLIAVGIVFLKRDAFARCRWESVPWGQGVVALALLAYFVGVRGVQERVVVFSFILMLYGLTLVIGGRDVMRLLFFPITFLLLMIPLNFLDDAIGFPLQIFMAKVSTVVLNWVGIETLRVGTSIRSEVFDFDVANPCSGIRSLMALTTVTAAFAYITQREQWKRWVMFLCAIPLAVLGNMCRVVGIALVGQVYGGGPAMRIHDYSGFIVFGVALVAMLAIGFLLNFPYRAFVEKWLQPLSQPPAVNPVLRQEEP
jgi:exosortase